MDLLDGINYGLYMVARGYRREKGLAHKDQAARDASFGAFRTDADWVKAKADSEKDGPLTAPDGVKFVLMKATDYSPLR